jgi:hypothetical protein
MLSVTYLQIQKKPLSCSRVKNERISTHVKV